MDLMRRRLIGGIGLLLCAPTIVRASSLMPVRTLPIEIPPMILNYDILAVPGWRIFGEASFDGIHWFRAELDEFSRMGALFYT